MTLHRSCCCGCSSPFRRFVRCYEDELHNPHVITLAKFDELGLLLGPGNVYLFDSPECGSFCGYFICDDAFPAGYDDWCLPGTLGNCSDCDETTLPYLLRPSDLDPNPFELLEDEGDDFNTGDCCDWHCPDRISAICDENPTFCDDGFNVRGCVCTSVDDLDVLIDVAISGPTTQDFPMIYDYFDCDGNFYFKEPGPPWTTTISWTYDGATLVDTEFCNDGTTPKSRTYRMEFTSNRLLTIRTPADACIPCTNTSDMLFGCMGTTGVCGSVGRSDLSNTWPTWIDSLKWTKHFRISVTDTSGPFGNTGAPARFEWVNQPASDPFDVYAESTITNPCYTAANHWTYGHTAGLGPDFGFDYPESDNALSACSGTSTVGQYQKHMELKPSTACILFATQCIYPQTLVSSLPGPEIDITVGFGLAEVNQEPDPC